MKIPFINSGQSRKKKEIDELIKRLEKIGDAIEPIDQMMGQLDDAIRDLRQVMEKLGADEAFVLLDGKKVLVDDAGDAAGNAAYGGDGGRPYRAIVKSLKKADDCDLTMLPTEIYSRVYGLILALKEYKFFV